VRVRWCVRAIVCGRACDGRSGGVHGRVSSIAKDRYFNHSRTLTLGSSRRPFSLLMPKRRSADDQKMACLIISYKLPVPLQSLWCEHATRPRTTAQAHAQSCRTCRPNPR
jgi:hypothetical protein